MCDIRHMIRACLMMLCNVVHAGVLVKSMCMCDASQIMNHVRFGRHDDASRGQAGRLHDS